MSAVGAKSNVPFVGWQKIELKKSAVEKNKKYIYCIIFKIQQYP